MKKTLLIIVPIVLVILVIVGVVIYFVLQFVNKKGTDNVDLLGISPTVETSVTGTSDSGNTGDSNTVENNACLLLTLDIAKEILGSDAILASQNPGNCTYSATNAETSAFGIITIVVTKTNPITAKEQFDQAKTISYSGDTETITELNADEAYFANTYKQLSILKGDSWIIISGTSDKFADEKEISMATAKLVLK
jgi:hypothetical protein